jgi:hypothetical protein
MVVTEAEANAWFRRNANAGLVKAFLEGERPVNWPDAIPFPPVVEVLPKDWVQRRREELGLSRRQ